MTEFYGAFKVLKPAFSTASTVSGNSSTAAATFNTALHQTADTSRRFIVEPVRRAEWWLGFAQPAAVGRNVSIDASTGVVTVALNTAAPRVLRASPFR